MGTDKKGDRLLAGYEMSSVWSGYGVVWLGVCMYRGGTPF
jgi:hypothetical protein